MDNSPQKLGQWNAQPQTQGLAGVRQRLRDNHIVCVGQCTKESDGRANHNFLGGFAKKDSHDNKEASRLRFILRLVA